MSDFMSRLRKEASHMPKDEHSCQVDGYPNYRCEDSDKCLTCLSRELLALPSLSGGEK
jgi:hypothetical protein